MTTLRLAAGAKHTVLIPNLKDDSPGAPGISPSPSRLQVTVSQPTSCSQAGQPAPLAIVRVSSVGNQLFRQDIKRPGTIVLEFSREFIEQRAPKGIDVDIAAGPCGFQGTFDLHPLT